jgi:predicted AlkP superfamily phosphohydrolase/phosphomutase
VLAVGLDAVEPTFLDRLLAEGALPALRRLRAASAAAHLVTARPYRSEFAWTEFVTGRTADDLGYWSTIQFDPASYQCIVAGAAPEEPFYALGDQRRVIALDVPHSRLSGRVEGAQVIGWGAHDPQHPHCSRPAGLLADLEREHGRHPGFAIEYAGSWNQPRYLTDVASAMVEGAGRRVGVVESLMARVPDWDLAVLAMGEAHETGHQMWHGIDPRSPLHDAPSAPTAAASIRAIHQCLDTTIGRILDRVPPDTTVIVFSVKGMTYGDAEVFAPVLVPELLHRLEFGSSWLRSPPTGPGGRILGPVIPDSTTRPFPVVRAAFAADPWSRVKRSARTRFPSGVERSRRWRAAPPRPRPEGRVPAILDDVALSDVAPSPRPVDSWNPAWWYRSRWPRMRAFVIPSFSDVHIRINVAGRERFGRVPPTEFDSVCDEVEREVRACTDPRTGRGVVGSVTRLRRGDRLRPGGPGADLVIESEGAVDVVSHPRAGTIGPFPFPRTGSHTPTGFAWISGPGIEPADLGSRAAVDLPATVLALLGLPGPEQSAGRPMVPAPTR